jgi:GT2 family glycosyltransferase
MPFELICVDVGSLDGTSEYLDGIAAGAPVRVEIVHAPSEMAFEVAVQEGFSRVRGEFIVWLNNDTLVANTWLQQLVGLATIHAAVGMVGPMSNVAPERQRLAALPFRLRRTLPLAGRGVRLEQGVFVDTAAVVRFAEEWRQKHKGEWFETDRLGGFCLLVKRSALERIPWLTQGGEQGVFDADALAWRFIQAGFRLAVCGDLFVYHFGSSLSFY